jgi:plasmid stabilization system protein ParE
MIPELVVTREARADLSDAVIYLANVSPGLPRKFENELASVFVSILNHPKAFPVVHKEFRRALLHRFPYSVFFIASPETVLIVGVVHQARDEETWKRRS